MASARGELSEHSVCAIVIPSLTRLPAEPTTGLSLMVHSQTGLGSILGTLVPSEERIRIMFPDRLQQAPHNFASL